MKQLVELSPELWVFPEDVRSITVFKGKVDEKPELTIKPYVTIAYYGTELSTSLIYGTHADAKADSERIAKKVNELLAIQS